MIEAALGIIMPILIELTKYLKEQLHDKEILLAEIEKRIEPLVSQLGDITQQEFDVTINFLENPEFTCERYLEEMNKLNLEAEDNIKKFVEEIALIYELHKDKLEKMLPPKFLLPFEDFTKFSKSSDTNLADILHCLLEKYSEFLYIEPKGDIESSMENLKEDISKVFKAMLNADIEKIECLKKHSKRWLEKWGLSEEDLEKLKSFISEKFIVNDIMKGVLKDDYDC